MVTAEVIEEPLSVANPGAAGDGRRGQTTTQMAEPGIGRVIEVAAHPRNTRHVSHEDEKRYDVKWKKCRYFDGFPAQRGKRRGNLVHDRGAHEADDEHGHGDRHADDQEEEKHPNPMKPMAVPDIAPRYSSVVCSGPSPFFWRRNSSIRTSV
ncbi:MAG: hypothetical protein QGF09_01400 [Rhodospirillales bacterium]|nr:hypothetical protein [Rhodospirillales bacterium]